MRQNRGIIKLIALFVLVLALTGCSEPSLDLAKNEEKVIDAPYVAPEAGSYDSSDCAIIVRINAKTKKITFYNFNLVKCYTLNYNGVTNFSDKYGVAMSAAQLKVGEVVDVNFLKSKKLLTDLAIATGSFEEEDITGFDINAWARTFTIGDESFKVSPNTYVLSDGKQISLSEVSTVDTVSIRGRNEQIESIVVENGHGYLSLQGADYFYGGFIEVGPKNIREVKEGMLLMVPAGKYDIRITHKGNEVLRSITIENGKETTMDLSDVEVKEEKRGKVTFVLNPENATVVIDGKAIDTAYPALCSYGLHKLTVSADGYSTLTKYFDVSKESDELTIYLLENPDEESDEDKKDVEEENGEQEDTQKADSQSEDDSETDDGDEENSDKEKTDDTSTDTSASDIDEIGDPVKPSEDEPAVEHETEPKPLDVEYLINIPGPEGVEIYWDGNYKGLAPISFAKESGIHVITLRKTGYETRSFTVTIDEDDENIDFSFDELSKE